MTYLRNAWYVAAFGEEIAPGHTIGRTLLGENVTLYRSEDGGLAALQTACPHRFAPLHQGKVHGRDIACPYHGLRFNPEGQCVHNPHGSGEIPKAARVRSYPVEERDGLAWIWMGDPARCDRAQVPAFPEVTELPPTTYIREHIRTNANYELMTDNIMDLSHADFLHPGSLSTSGSVTRLLPEIDDRGDVIRVSWRWTSSSPAPVFAAVAPPDTPCDMWLQVTWRPAALMRIRFGVERPDGAEPVEVRGCHIMTPETGHSTHYFFYGSRNFLVDDARFSEIAREQILYAFGQEDKPIIEEVQRAMGDADLWSLKPVLLSGDAGAVRVRRKLQTLVAAEAV